MNKDFFIQIISWASAIGTSIPLFFGVFRYKYLQNPLKWIVLLFGIGSLTELVSLIYATSINPNNVWIFNIYQIIETTIIIIFYSMLTQVKLKKRLLYLFIILFTIVSVYQISNIGSARLNDLSFSIESIIVVLLSILNFNSILKKQIYSNILNAPIFWFNSGFLIFFSGNLFLHIFSKFLLIHALYAFFELWGVWHSLLNILFYLLISVGFWKIKTLQT